MIDLYCGDCLNVLKTITNGSIDLTVTSPPLQKDLSSLRKRI